MTTIASFFSKSEGGKKTLSMISDSRITWPVKDSSGNNYSYNHSQKIFHLTNSLDVFGYCGDSLFSLIVLSQMVSCLNNSLPFTASMTFDEKKDLIFELLSDSLNTYPTDFLFDGFNVIWNCSVKNELYCNVFIYNGKLKTLGVRKMYISTETSLVYCSGSGFRHYKNELKELDYLHYNFSRTYFKALIDIIENNLDPKTGGPPQMASIIDNKAHVVSTAILFNSKYYLYGIEDKLQMNNNNVEYRNSDFSYLTPHKEVKVRNNYANSFVRKFFKKGT